jgi:hypothetical protein
VGSSHAQSSERSGTKVIYGRVSPEVHEMAHRCAAIEDRTISSLVRQALLLYFQHQGYFDMVEEATENEGETWPDWMNTQQRS